MTSQSTGDARTPASSDASLIELQRLAALESPISTAGLVDRFANIFEGGMQAHGRFTLTGGTREDGKVLTKSDWVKETVTSDDWRLHLEGKTGLGLNPILDTVNDDGNRYLGRWVGADIDIYKNFDHAQLVKKLNEIGAPVLVCKSKSAGAHVYLFALEPIPAVLMRACLKVIIGKTQYTVKEFFPKQDIVPPSGFGNWLAFPYFGFLCHGVDPEGNTIPLEKFVHYAEGSRKPRDWFEAYLNVAPGGALATRAPRVMQSVLDMSDEAGEGMEGVKKPTVALTRAILRFVEVEEYDPWIDTCFSIKNSFSDDEVARGLWHRYSSRSERYNRAEAESKYNECPRGGDRGYGALVFDSKAKGWKRPSLVLPDTLPTEGGADTYTELVGQAQRLLVAGHSAEEILNLLIVINKGRAVQPLPEEDLLQISKDVELEAAVHALPKGLPDIASNLFDEGMNKHEIEATMRMIEAARQGKNSTPEAEMKKIIEAAERTDRQIPVSSLKQVEGLKRTRKGELYSNLLNAFALMKRSPDFKDLYFDEFRKKVMLREKDGNVREWIEHDANIVTRWLQRYDLNLIGTDTATRAALDVAWERRRNPLMEYLDSLKWDGVSRIDNWLIEFCKAADNRAEECRLAAQAFLTPDRARRWPRETAAEAIQVYYEHQHELLRTRRRRLGPVGRKRRLPSASQIESGFGSERDVAA